MIEMKYFTLEILMSTQNCIENLGRDLRKRGGVLIFKKIVF